MCTICLAGRQGVRAPDKNWRDATMSADDLEDMPPKFRQHLVRRHSMLASSHEAKAMISYAKALMCPFLHSPPEQVIIWAHLFVSPGLVCLLHSCKFIRSFICTVMSCC